MTKNKVISSLNHKLHVVKQEINDANGKELNRLLDKKKSLEDEINRVTKMTYLDIQEYYGDYND